MKALVKKGKTRAIGLSNFSIAELRDILPEAHDVPISCNQIEVHPFNTQLEITEFCALHDIVIEAYAPLARALRFKHPTVKKLSGKYGCTPAQLFVRWSLQHGYVPLPKSSKEERIASNADVEELEISKEDMEVLDGLDERLITDWDPYDAP